jgi:hypothetical protein
MRSGVWNVCGILNRLSPYGKVRHDGNERPRLHLEQFLD